jgi:hypothetical protein
MRQTGAKFLLIGLISLIVLFTGCGSEKKPDSQDGQKSEVATSQKADVKSTPAAEYHAKIKFKTSQGTEALVIKKYQDHEKLEIDFAETKAVIKSRANDKGRVKYREDTAEGEKKLVAEIKYKDDGFKLVDESESLLFKVKIKDDKIKIANNEEMTDSFVIKKKNDNKFEIRDKSENEIGNVKFYPDNGKLKVKDAAENEILIAKELKSTPAPGPILFEEIPVKLRFIIIAELLKRGN